MGGSGLFVDENGAVTYEGRTVSVSQKSSGKYILDVDGKKIRVTPEQLVLMYTYFSVLFKHYSAELEHEK